MNLYAIGPFGTSVLALFSGIFVYFKNRRAKLNRLFCLLCISVFIWAFGYSQMYNTKSNDSLALFWSRLGYCGVVFIPVFTWHYIVTFLNLKRRRLTTFIIYLIGFLFLIISRTDLFLYAMHSSYFWGYYPKAGPLYIYFVLFFTWIFIRAPYLLFHSFRLNKNESIPVQVNRIKYLLFGFGIATTSIVDYLPNYGIEIYPWAYLSAIGWLICMGWASFRYRLMDINIALTRAGIFVFVYLFVLGIPFALGYRYGQWKLATWVTVFLATTGPFIYLFLQRRAEDALLKERRCYQETINNLSKSMIDIRDIVKLLPTITSTVGEAVKMKFAVIYLRQDEYKAFQLKSCYPQEAKSGFHELISFDDPLIGILNQRKKPALSEEISHQEKINLDSGVVIPLFSKDGLLGFIVLGAKQNNQMYTNDDLIVLETLSYNTSFAIENCIFWKEIEDRHRKARLQEMDAFSYSLAHEIDNPMTFVYNLARFLKGHFLKYITEQEERKEVEEACGYIMEGSERVMSMVKAIRQFGQKTTGEFETLNLQEIIEGFFKLYGPELKGNFVIYAKEMPDDAIYVKGVAAELQQVLMIFSKNSIHAMKCSQEKKLSLKVTKLNHNTARIALSDTGYGIRKENLETIFAPFFTSKASTEGTGMGLHNAKGFVLRHNGKIWAESEGEGKGATFIFELPILQDVNTQDFKKNEKTDWAF